MNSSIVVFLKSRSIWVTIICLFHTVLAFGAGWLIWGWLTISDIRRWCESNNKDFETVIRDINSSSIESLSRNPDGTLNLKARPRGPLSRLDQGTFSIDSTYSIATSSNSPSGTLTLVETIPLYYFSSNSDNVLNTWFCAAFGYLMGLLTLTSQLSSNRVIPLQQVFLKPIISSGSSSLMFLLVLSGGAMLWTKAPAVNSIGVGVIAIVGAIQGERLLRKIGKLKDPVSSSEQVD